MFNHDSPLAINYWPLLTTINHSWPSWNKLLIIIHHYWPVLTIIMDQYWPLLWTSIDHYYEPVLTCIDHYYNVWCWLVQLAHGIRFLGPRVSRQTLSIAAPPAPRMPPKGDPKPCHETPKVWPNPKLDQVGSRSKVCNVWIPLLVFFNIQINPNFRHLHVSWRPIPIPTPNISKYPQSPAPSEASLSSFRRPPPNAPVASSQRPPTLTLSLSPGVQLS